MSENFSLKCQEIITERGSIKDGYINVTNGIIESITKTKESRFDSVPLEASKAVPGFIDIHTHGYFGIDSMASDEQGIHTWATRIAKHGVTGFVPTCVSADLNSMLLFFSKISHAKSNQRDTEARLLGSRSEGPYISRSKIGAHNPDYVRQISLEEIKTIVASGSSSPLIIDIAPELDNFTSALSLLETNGTIVSAGHTNCSFGVCNDAFKNGVRLVTHFYNAMSGCESRNPGMVTAGLLADNVFLEMIADLHHVSAEAINVVAKTRGWRSIIGITDSLSIGESGKTKGTLGGLDIVISDGVAWIAGTNTIAGSILTPDRGFKNLIKIGASILDATMVYSSNPARLLNLADRGDIAPGKRADLTFLDDDLNVVETMINGKIIPNQ